MSLHPDIEAFLELAELSLERGRTPMYLQTPKQARIEYEATASMLDSGSIDMAHVMDIVIPARDGYRIPIRLYIPIGAMLPAPALLYFHGGGYCVGSLDSHDALCRDIAHKSGCIVLAVDYRLAPEHKFPTAFFDAEDSYHWLLAEGGNHGVDVGRIAIGGDSAGGTLATAICLALKDGRLPQPQLQVLLYPCTSSEQNTASHQRLASGYLLEAKTLQWMFGHYLRNPQDRQDWRFAPLMAADAAGLPPAFISLAEYDPLLDEGKEYAGKLRNAGVTVQLDIAAGMVHDFARLADITEDAQALRQRIADALDTALKKNTHDPFH